MEETKTLDPFGLLPILSLKLGGPEQGGLSPEQLEISFNLNLDFCGDHLSDHPDDKEKGWSNVLLARSGKSSGSLRSNWVQMVLPASNSV